MDASPAHLELPREPESSEHESLDQLVAFAYRELRTIAHARLRAVNGNGTLSTTALVHEVYLKLVDQ